MEQASTKYTARLQKGQKQKARDIAKALLAKKMKIVDVSEVTGLSVEEVNKLKADADQN